MKLGYDRLALPGGLRPPPLVLEGSLRRDRTAVRRRSWPRSAIPRLSSSKRFQQAIAQGAPRKLCGILVDEQFGSAVARDGKDRWDAAGDAGGEVGSGRVPARIRRRLRTAHRGLRSRLFEGAGSLQPRGRSRAEPASDPTAGRSLGLAACHAIGSSCSSCWSRATPAQLERCGDQERFDREMRAGLVVQVLRELQQGGVEPDIWKIEGLETAADCRAVVEQATTGPGREQVVCIVLGRGASIERVLDVAVRRRPGAGLRRFRGRADPLAGRLEAIRRRQRVA